MVRLSSSWTWTCESNDLSGQAIYQYVPFIFIMYQCHGSWIAVWFKLSAGCTASVIADEKA